MNDEYDFSIDEPTDYDTLNPDVGENESVPVEKIDKQYKNPERAAKGSVDNNPEASIMGIEKSLKGSMNQFPKQGDGIGEVEITAELKIPKNPVMLDPELLNHDLMGEGIVLKFDTMINEKIIKKGSVIRVKEMEGIKAPGEGGSQFGTVTVDPFSAEKPDDKAKSLGLGTSTPHWDPKPKSPVTPTEESYWDKVLSLYEEMDDLFDLDATDQLADDKEPLKKHDKHINSRPRNDMDTDMKKNITYEGVGANNPERKDDVGSQTFNHEDDDALFQYSTDDHDVDFEPGI